MGLERISLLSPEARQQRVAIYDQWLKDELPEEELPIQDSAQEEAELPTSVWGVTPQAGTF